MADTYTIINGHSVKLIDNGDGTYSFAALPQITTHTFHNAATSTGNGTEFTVGNMKTLTIEIYGTSTSRTIEFYGKGDSGTLRSIKGINLSTFEAATSTTGTGELWQFDITGLISVVIKLAAVSGGDVTIKGRAVA